MHIYIYKVCAVDHDGTAGFSPCFHLPGFRFGYLFLTHSHIYIYILYINYYMCEYPAAEKIMAVV